MRPQKFENIPEEMKPWAQWVIWRYEVRNGKQTKVPYCARSNRGASVTDPSTWATFAEACAAYEAGMGDGIGFVLTEGDPFTFIDLDVKEGESPTPEQQSILDRSRGYVELSPSGRGVHIIGKGQVPSGRKSEKRKIEVYSSARYMTMTGDVFRPGAVEPQQDLLQGVWASLGDSAPQASQDVPDAPQTASDEDVDQWASTAVNSDKYRALRAGNWQGVYASQSEADQALVNIIAFYTKNKAQIARMFRSSALGKRDKANRDDYMNGMIAMGLDREFEAVDHTAIVEAGREKLAATQPVDLFGQLQPPTVPTDLPPKIIEWWANAKAKELGCDPAGLILSALVTCAAAIPDRHKVKVKPNGNWLESPRLWGIIIGQPSAKKTPQLNAATEPLSRIDARLVRDYLRRKEEYDALSPEERKAKKPPVMTRLRIEDATIEAMQEVLVDSPNGVMSRQDELSGWFASLERYGNSAGADRAAWLKSYDGGEYVVDRIKRGTRVVPNWSACILGAIQPEAIRKVAANTADDGLLQRFLPIILRPATVTSAEPSPLGLDEWYSKLVEGCHSFALVAAPFEFTPEAQAVQRRAEIRHNELQSIESVSPKLASHIGKYDGIFARLCVVFHVVEHLGNGLNGHPVDFQRIAKIEEDVAVRVYRFMHEFLLPHAAAFYQNVLGLSSDWDRLQDIAAYIVAHKLQEIDARTVQRGDRALRSLKNDEIKPMFEQLAALGWIESIEGPRRNSTKHVVNPQVHTLFAERANAEMTRRNKAKAELRSLFGKGGDSV
ncbi:MAG: DUF3987 domain-containing protein [Paracoccaceae bacterium]